MFIKYMGISFSVSFLSSFDVSKALLIMAL